VNRLFVELYLDEDVSVLIADLVRARGFVAMTTREAGMLHREDPEQLAFAVERQAVMLTHNRTDYEALAEPPGFLPGEWET
jgi:predicted nuclease of predicted toxin-antitoxin system